MITLSDCCRIFVWLDQQLSTYVNLNPNPNPINRIIFPTFAETVRCSQPEINMRHMVLNFSGSKQLCVILKAFLRPSRPITRWASCFVLPLIREKWGVAVFTSAV